MQGQRGFHPADQIVNQEDRDSPLTLHIEAALLLLNVLHNPGLECGALRGEEKKGRKKGENSIKTWETTLGLPHEAD